MGLAQVVERRALPQRHVAQRRPLAGGEIGERRALPLLIAGYLSGRVLRRTGKARQPVVLSAVLLRRGPLAVVGQALELGAREGHAARRTRPLDSLFALIEPPLIAWVGTLEVVWPRAI